MKFRISPILAWSLILALTCWGAEDPVASRLARLARKAEDSGQTVRAYLLFAEAAARDPHNPSYRANRDALASAAKLLTQAHVETADVSADIQTAQKEAANPEPPIELASSPDWQAHNQDLQPLPQVKAANGKRDFDLHGNTKSILQQVAAAYGVKSIEDSDLQSGIVLHFEIKDADFKTALEAVTAATDTFVFPASEKVIYFAPDTETKRNELEPIIVLTFPLQEALTERDLIEAANAVRGLLTLRTIGWDSFNRRVVIRDRVTRAHIAQSLLEALLLPRAQVSFELQFIALDKDRNYHYGATLQTAFQLIDFGRIGGFKGVLPTATNSSTFLTFGSGATLFGVGIAEATAFASYSKSFAQQIYDATVVVGDRQTVDFHVGDKYPIPTSLYTGSDQGLPSIYNPAPEITMEDLGLVLKITPHVNGSGDIDCEVEADYKTLGTETFNSVPSIAERSLKGTFSLREGEWAILAGMNSTSRSVSRSGLAGVAGIPGLNQILNENTRDTQSSDTLIVIKPTLTRLPMNDTISPQFLIGPLRGERVLL